jgi:hypothetical protein
MAFSPNLFLSNIKGKDGLARPCRFEVVLPIPPYIGQSVSNSLIERILNFPNSAFSDISDAINSALPQSIRGGDSGMKSSNPAMSRYLALQCETAELPGKTLETADVRVYGPSFKVPYRSQYAESSFTFICTNEFYERKLFDKWLDAINPPDTNNLRFPKGINSSYMTRLKVIQYDDFIKQIYAVEFIDAFPIGVSPQQVSWSDEGFHRLTVNFAYQKYEPIFEGNYDLGAAAATLFGTGATRLLSI